MSRSANSTSTLSLTTNPYLHAARLRKALALATILHGYGVTRDLASHADQGFWNELSRLLDLRAPSSATIELTLNLLDRMNHPPDPMEPFKRG